MNRVRILRQFIGRKIDRGDATAAALQFGGDIPMADSELQNTLAGDARFDRKSLR